MHQQRPQAARPPGTGVAATSGTRARRAQRSRTRISWFESISSRGRATDASVAGRRLQGSGLVEDEQFYGARGHEEPTCGLSTEMIDCL
jgi:hypothetical protein